MKNLSGHEIDEFANDIFKVLKEVPLFYLNEVLELAKEGREREDTSYCIIIDDCYNEFNKHGKKGGAILNIASRFRHYVNAGDPVMMLYSTQKYLDLLFAFGMSLSFIIVPSGIL